jgi:hypothetical protein
VKHAKDVHGVARNAVRDQVWQSGYHQLGGARNMTGPPRLREVMEAKHRGPDPVANPFRSNGIIGGDERHVTSQ